MQREVHRIYAARCHFAAFRRCALRATMMGSTILGLGRGSMQHRPGWGSLARLGQFLRARELTTFLLDALSLANSGFMLSKSLRRLPRQRRCSCSGSARLLLCAEQRIYATLCEAFGLGVLASAGRSLGQTVLTSKVPRRASRRQFWGSRAAEAAQARLNWQVGNF